MGQCRELLSISRRQPENQFAEQLVRGSVVARALLPLIAALIQQARPGSTTIMTIIISDDDDYITIDGVSSHRNDWRQRMITSISIVNIFNCITGGTLPDKKPRHGVQPSMVKP